MRRLQPCVKKEEEKINPVFCSFFLSPRSGGTLIPFCCFLKKQDSLLFKKSFKRRVPIVIGTRVWWYL